MFFIYFDHDSVQGQISRFSYYDFHLDRGFSSIEKWFYGMQAMILLAVLEYGLVLALKMFYNMKSDQFKLLDFGTFVTATIVLSIFNICYWNLLK